MHKTKSKFQTCKPPMLLARGTALLWWALVLLWATSGLAYAQDVTYIWPLSFASSKLTAASTALDPDNDPLSYTFTWKVNGVVRKMTS